MTTTAEHYIAAIGLNAFAYQHDRSCHCLIILTLPARLHGSQGDKPYCCLAANYARQVVYFTRRRTRHMFIAYSVYLQVTMMIGSGCPEVL